MCHSAAICGDIPTDNADNYNFVIEIQNDMNDEQIIQVIEYYLNNEKERMKKVNNGIEFSKKYTKKNMQINY